MYKTIITLLVLLALLGCSKKKEPEVVKEPAKVEEQVKQNEPEVTEESPKSVTVETIRPNTDNSKEPKVYIPIPIKRPTVVVDKVVIVQDYTKYTKEKVEACTLDAERLCGYDGTQSSNFLDKCFKKNINKVSKTCKRP